MYQTDDSLGAFEGSNLDMHLAQFRIKRGFEENDWDLRRRAFLAICCSSPESAVEVLLGLRVEEWGSLGTITLTQVRDICSKRCKNTLANLVRSFGADPLVLRKLNAPIKVMFVFPDQPRRLQSVVHF